MHNYLLSDFFREINQYTFFFFSSKYTTLYLYFSPPLDVRFFKHFYITSVLTIATVYCNNYKLLNNLFNKEDRMKKTSKRIIALALSAALSAGMGLTAYAGSWQFIGPENWKWYYNDDDGSRATSAWREIDGKWYHFIS